MNTYYALLLLGLIFAAITNTISHPIYHSQRHYDKHPMFPTMNLENPHEDNNVWQGVFKSMDERTRRGWGSG
ncbi:hypothetical protein I4U23_024734 [Adineta vaga]|nr:hypothetical protein I4U23_024734 [Adineta vaga]